MADISLPAQLDIRHVADIRKLLTKKRRARALPKLDASAVERVDTAGAQLIAAALLAEPPLAAGLSKPSDALSSALASLGLTRLVDGAAE